MRQKLEKKPVRARPKQSAAPTRIRRARSEYDKDFIKWIETQVNLIKNGHTSQLDIENLVEEIESLGRSDKRSLKSYTVVLLMHLLKKEYHKEGEGNLNSWNSSILNATQEIKYLLEDSPSLKNELIKIFPKAYDDAVQRAALESHLSIKSFPKKCPWEIEDVLPFLKKKTEL